MAKQSHPARWIMMGIGLAGAGTVAYMLYKRAKRATSSPVTATVTINKPPLQVYERFRDFASLPEFMTYLESVEVIGPTTTRWTAKPIGKGPALTWEAETLEDIPGQVIVWQTRNESTIQTRGRVEFTSAPGTTQMTEVRVEMQIGIAGVGASSVLARLFATPQVKGDMRRFKMVMETGEVLRSDASAHTKPHPAQPSADAEPAPLVFVPSPPTAEKGLGHPETPAIGGKGVS